MDNETAGERRMQAYSNNFGFPLWLEKLRDNIFEKLSPEKRNDWHVSYKKAIKYGMSEKEFEMVKAKFLVFVLDLLLDNKSIDKSIVLLIEKSKKIWLNYIETGVLDKKAAADTADAAYVAADAADAATNAATAATNAANAAANAANAAAKVAKAAAKAASKAAAKAAANANATAAAYAAYAAAYAAYAAAANAAYAAYAAAYATATATAVDAIYEKYADYLITLLSCCNREL